MGTRFRIAWAVLRSATREARDNDVPMLAQALAYSLFLAIPAAALVILGAFSLLADPETVTSLVEQAGHVMPAEATALLEDSLQRSVESTRDGVAMTVVGFALAIWSTTSAATTLMHGLTHAYDADDTRGFVAKRVRALVIVVALVLSAALVVVLLVLGPHVERWLGSALDREGLLKWTWWTLQWPCCSRQCSSPSPWCSTSDRMFSTTGGSV